MLQGTEHKVPIQYLGAAQNEASLHVAHSVWRDTAPSALYRSSRVVWSNTNPLHHSLAPLSIPSAERPSYECGPPLSNTYTAMAPSKARAAPDDSRSEASSTRERHGGSGHGTTTTKGRRGGTGAASSSLRDVTTAGSAAAGATSAPNGAAQEANVGVSCVLFMFTMRARVLTLPRCNGRLWTQKSCKHIATYTN